MNTVQTVSIGDFLDITSPTLYRNPKLVLEVGQHYTNYLGLLVKLVQRKVRPGGWNDRRFSHYFIDEEGQRYWPDGEALKGSVGGKPCLYLRSLADKALKVKVGQRYAMHWRDGGVTIYRVTEVCPTGYKVRWDNGATLEIRYGVPLNYESVLIH